ncbi:kinesin-like protein KIF26A isoform X1 [Xenopus tropicalis]|uniref:Kinesin family member 26A n=2 Tax=Xenopus tropicalis TaxID=8364 RepID=A0A6I8SLJ9_XENTR|nr:kinesin-like protein KIF26A isoform X1 [Xenopus tropicalis]
MACDNSSDQSAPARKNPSLLEIGALCLDSEIIFGFTSHLLRRRGKVSDRLSGREVPPCPRKRLQSADEALRGSRPPPEGAGASSVSEGAVPGEWCPYCQAKLAELKKQALRLAIPGCATNPQFSALIFDKLQVPDYLQKSRNEGENRCDICATHLNQLKQEAVQMIQSFNQAGCSEILDRPPSSVPVASVIPRLSPQNMITVSPQKELLMIAGQVGRPSGKSTNLFHGTEKKKGLGWGQGGSSLPNSSVQVTVAPSSLGGALSSVTIQAQQYLEGMWSISRVNSFLPSACLPDAPSMDGGRENQNTEISSGPSNNQQSVTGSTQSFFAPAGAESAGTSAAASFFIRAAQKLNLSSKRKKYHPPLPHSQEYSTYSTNFSGILQLCPPPAPPCLMRAVSKIKDNPGIGKVKIMVRICPFQGPQNTSESMSFLKVDPRKKQVTLYDPSTCGPSVSVHRRAVVAVPKMFAFDSVFPQDASQAEVCSGTVAEVIQSVVNGADGCIFCFGHVRLGKSYTMIGKDASTQSLGIIPCAISWLFKLINERKEKTGTRFSIRVSAVEIFGKDENLKDLLAEEATGSLQDGQSPGVYLREDPICGTQLQNQSELRAPTAEKAAHFLDAALAARSTSRPDCDEEERRNSHMLFTLHIYQYRMEKSGKGGMSGGRSRLHLIDLGSCEKVLSKSRDGCGGLCLSLTALGNVILALVNGAKHIPYRDSKLTMLLQESLGNINCRTTMIAHISDSPANYQETLSTVQLASRIHRMKKKKSKYASSSSGGESSCEEGRVRRPPHIRPFHQRTVVLDPDFPTLGFHSDPDYSSSSEQSCDTVIYVGPNGAALSDKELTDNEGPPEFVPIIPSLLKKRSKDNLSSIRSSDNDHLKCNTFAELQERLECIDGSEEPARFLIEEPVAAHCNKAMNYEDNVHSTKEKTLLSGICKRPGFQDMVSPKKGQNIIISTAFPPNISDSETNAPQSAHEHPQQHAKAENVKPECISDGNQVTIMDLQKTLAPSVCKAQEIPKGATEISVKEKALMARRHLPSPAPPPGSQSCSSNNVGVRTPPIGMSKLKCQDKHKLVSSTLPVGISTPKQPGPIEVRRFRSAVKTNGFDRDILTTTVTLQKPVELNGEDELVFTVVEELSIGGILDNGRPSSIISFNSDCSLQALASGSRPVSIISSINDEFDAYTSQVATAGVNIDIVVPLAEDQCTISSRRSSISSWLSEVSICTIKSDRAQTYNSIVPHSSHKSDELSECLNMGSEKNTDQISQSLKSSLNDSGFCFSELESESMSSSPLFSSNEKSFKISELTKASQVAHSASNKSSSIRGTISFETIHSSLPRKHNTTSVTTHGHAANSKEQVFSDPWFVRADTSLEGMSDNQALSTKSSISGTDNQLKQGLKSAQNISSASKPLKSQTLACSQRVVDGCEVDAKSAPKKTEPLTKVPQLRRGATTLGVVTTYNSQTDYASKGISDGSLKSSGGKKNLMQKSSMLPRPGGTVPPAPPVRKSSLDQKNVPLHASKLDGLEGNCSEEEAEKHCSNTIFCKGDNSLPKTASSLKAKVNKNESVQRYGSHMSLERCDSVTSIGSKTNGTRDNSNSCINKVGRAVPKLGNPIGSSTNTSSPTCSAAAKTNQAKSSLTQKATNLNKNRSLSTNGSKSLSSSVKSLNQPSGKNSGIPPSGKAGSRPVQCMSTKPARGTIMGTKQALRAANNRVNELASGSSGKMNHFRGSTDSDSGNDSGINLSDEKLQTPVLPSPYSKITAPRRPQRYSSGHGSDNSSVLSGELPPAMGRTALFYHSGGSSGYESMIRDSEATGSASSAHDSMSESGMSSSGRMRSLKSPKKRGLQRRRLVPTPLPETATTGQWVDLPPLPGNLKEPFEIKVYEIDDVERLQKHRQEEPEQPFQDVEKGLMYFSTKLSLLERRQQKVKDVKAKYELLKQELEETKHRLMMHPHKWRGQFEVDPSLDKESQEYLEALEQVTEELELCVNVCKSHVMMVTCFDIGMISDQQDGGREVEV